MKYVYAGITHPPEQYVAGEGSMLAARRRWNSRLPRSSDCFESRGQWADGPLLASRTAARASVPIPSTRSDLDR